MTTFTPGQVLTAAELTSLQTQITTAQSAATAAQTTASAAVVLNGAGGTPTALNLVNATGLPGAGIASGKVPVARLPTINLFNTGASVGNGADTTEDTLQTFVIPAGQLANVGDRIVIEAGGALTGSADVKVVRLRFNGGSGAAITSNASTEVAWMCRLVMMKTGANTQASVITFGATTISAYNCTTGALTDTSAITLTVTGQNNTNFVAGSITCRYLTVDYIPGT